MTDVAERTGWPGLESVLGAEITEVLFPSVTVRWPIPPAVVTEQKTVLRRGRRVNEKERDSSCTNDRHGRSQNAWRLGCRCPGALAAHERRLAYEREHRAAIAAAVRAGQEGCPALRHAASENAWTLGCRCAGAVAAHERVKERNRINQAARRDPREPWRGAHMQVSEITVQHVAAGLILPGKVNRIEAALAARRLVGTPHRDGTRLMQPLDAAQRLRVDLETIRRYGKMFGDLRKERTQRRLADVIWRERRRAAAVRAGREHDRSGHPRKETA